MTSNLKSLTALLIAAAPVFMATPAHALLLASPWNSPQPIPVPAVDNTTKVVLGSGASRASSVFGLRPVSTPLASAPSLYCKLGYVWRVARPSDLVCVTPTSRATVANENLLAPSRLGRERGPYGRNTCKIGFVWREAFVGDVVCVTPERRTLVAYENRIGPSLRAQ